jgi:SET domain-containing protein
MDAFEYISTKVFIKLKPSKIAGIGLFAIKDIPSGTKIFEPWTGKTGYYGITQNELESLDKELADHIRDLFLFSENFPADTSLYVKLTEGYHWIYLKPYYFINSGFYENTFNVDKNSMTTLRDIKCGEELLSNYQKYEKLDKSNLI